MTLFPDEQIITQSNNNVVTLTTHRIMYEQKSFARANTISIMLEHITSCETLHKKHTFFLILAFICLLMLGVDDLAPVAGIGAVVFVALFFIKQQSIVRVASSSATILINASGMNRQKILNFIDQIEQAKHKRLLLLKK